MLFLFYLSSTSFALEYTNEGLNIGDKIISLKSGDTFTINFDQPYGLLLIHDWKDCVIEYDVKDIETGYNENKRKFFSDLQNSVLIGLYLSNTIGSVKISTFSSATPSFSWATFPKDCDMKYVQNVIDGGVKLQKQDIGEISSVCFYSSAKTPLQYTINYDILQQQNSTVTFIQANHNETFSIRQNEPFSKIFNESSILHISENLSENLNFLEITAKSLTDMTLPQVDFGKIIAYDNITFIIVNLPKVGTKNIKFIIFGILGSIIVIVASLYLIFGCHKRKHRNQKISETSDSTETMLSRPPTPEHIQIDQFQSDSADGDDPYALHNSKDEFALDVEGYPQNDYNPSNVEYVAPKPVLLKTVLNEVNAKQ